MSKNKIEISPSEKKIFVSSIGFVLENLADLMTKAVTFTERATEALSSDTKLKNPVSIEMMVKAGKMLKDMRETAGLSLEELSLIVKTRNSGILKRIEEGQAALPIELMLRLASLYSRNDPLPFIIRFSRTYYPGLNEILRKIGIDRLLIQGERELEFINIYRSAESARDLSDEQYDQVVGFTRKAFETALCFASEQKKLEKAGD